MPLKSAIELRLSLNALSGFNNIQLLTKYQMLIVILNKGTHLIY